MLNKINPYIRVATHSVFPPQHHIKPRIIFDYELIYIEDSGLTFIYNGVPYSVVPGDFLFLCPDICHEFRIGATSISQPHIHFDMTYDMLSHELYVCFSPHEDLTPKQLSLIRTNLFFGLQTSPILSLKNKEAFVNTFFSIIDAPNKYDLLTKANMLSLIQTIIEDNYPSLLKSKPKQSTPAESIKDFLDKNYETPLSLDHIAEFFSYNKYYLDRCFVKQYGIPIIQYRNRQRLEKAKRMLGHYRITEIAQRLGFSSIYTFSRAFKDYTGLSPSEFRKQSEPILSD